MIWKLAMSSSRNWPEDYSVEGDENNFWFQFLKKSRVRESQIPANYRVKDTARESMFDNWLYYSFKIFPRF